MFNSNKEIEDYINALGVFTNKNGELYVKTSSKDCEKVGDVYINGVAFKPKDRLINHILNNTNPFLDFYIVFKEIDLKVFKQYDNRNKAIKKITAEQQKIKDAPQHMKKHFRLVHFSRISKKFSKYWIYDIKENNLTEIDESLLSEPDKKKALSYTNKAIFKKIIDDTLENEYADAYKENLTDFNALKINENYGS